MLNQQWEDGQKLLLCEDTSEGVNVLDSVNFKNRDTGVHIGLQVA